MSQLQFSSDSSPPASVDGGNQGSGRQVSIGESCLYVLKQYLSTANRRELQWLRLGPQIGSIQIWHQAQRNFGFLLVLLMDSLFFPP